MGRVGVGLWLVVGGGGGGGGRWWLHAVVGCVYALRVWCCFTALRELCVYALVFHRMGKGPRTVSVRVGPSGLVFFITLNVNYPLSLFMCKFTGLILVP